MDDRLALMAHASALRCPSASDRSRRSLRSVRDRNEYKQKIRKANRILGELGWPFSRTMAGQGEVPCLKADGCLVCMLKVQRSSAEAWLYHLEAWSPGFVPLPWPCPNPHLPARSTRHRHPLSCVPLGAWQPLM
eukprot:365198-Chlamydomonas_euryale.AAC.11